MKIWAPLFLAACFVLGWLIAKPSRPPEPTISPQPTYSQTWEWMDSVNLEYTEIDGVPVVKSGGWMVFLLPDSPPYQEPFPYANRRIP